nr:hypothetical protein CFP56_29892 [Quercus suber]
MLPSSTVLYCSVGVRTISPLADYTTLACHQPRTRVTSAAPRGLPPLSCAHSRCPALAFASTSRHARTRRLASRHVNPIFFLAAAADKSSVQDLDLLPVELQSPDRTWSIGGTFRIRPVDMAARHPTRSPETVPERSGTGELELVLSNRLISNTTGLNPQRRS